MKTLDYVTLDDETENGEGAAAVGDDLNDELMAAAQ
jgi:hypothetical protein